MRRSGTLAAGALALLVAASTVGGSVVGSATTTAAAPVGYAGPARGVTHVRRTTTNTSAQFTSRNWGGYITYDSSHATDFNAVKATWIQPTVKCEADQAWTVFWVGVDGWWNNTVEQGGTSAYCPTKGGAAQYTLWWEMYPTNPIQTVLAIKVGDKVTASVTYSPATAVFTIKVRDITSGKGFTKKEKCASGITCYRSSTDVITEDVGRFGAGTYFPLANYGTMSYGGVRATNTAGHAGSVSDTHWLNAAVTEYSAGVTYATVSALHNNGTAFSVTWKHR